VYIIKSLVDTTRLVALRRNAVKLALYRHFRNTLVFAVVGRFSTHCCHVAMFPVYKSNMCFGVEVNNVFCMMAVWHCVVLC